MVSDLVHLLRMNILAQDDKSDTATIEGSTTKDDMTEFNT